MDIPDCAFFCRPLGLGGAVYGAAVSGVSPTNSPSSSPSVDYFWPSTEILYPCFRDKTRARPVLARSGNDNVIVLAQCSKVIGVES